MCFLNISMFSYSARAPVCISFSQHSRLTTRTGRGGSAARGGGGCGGGGRSGGRGGGVRLRGFSRLRTRRGGLGVLGALVVLENAARKSGALSNSGDKQSPPALEGSVAVTTSAAPGLAAPPPKPPIDTSKYDMYKAKA